MRVFGLLLLGLAGLAAGCSLLQDLGALEAGPFDDAGVTEAPDARREPVQDASTIVDAPPDADAVVDGGPDVLAPFTCATVNANLCDDYERTSGLIGAWSSFQNQGGNVLEIRPLDAAGRALFLDFVGGDAAVLPATYMRLDTPEPVRTLSWEADVFFSAYPAADIRRIADLVLEQPSLPRLALLVRSESTGGSTLTVQYPGASGDVYDEKPMAKKLVPNQVQHVRLAYEAGDGGALRGVLTIDGVVVIDTPLPDEFVVSKMTVYQGSSYQTAQESWSSRYDNTVIRFAP